MISNTMYQLQNSGYWNGCIQVRVYEYRLVTIIFYLYDLLYMQSIREGSLYEPIS